MKKSKIVLVAASTILSSAQSEVKVVENEHRFEAPPTPLTDCFLPEETPIILTKSNPWPEPHKSSKKRRRY